MDVQACLIISGKTGMGGLRSFSAALSEGFNAIGIKTTVASTLSIIARPSLMLDPSILKVYSTTAIFLAPFSRNAICVAHGAPSVSAQGPLTFALILLSYIVASRFSRLVCVSHYSASQLSAIFGIWPHAVIHNPILTLFSEPSEQKTANNKITYVGRLHSVKNLDKIIPPALDLMYEDKTLELIIIGDGEMRSYAECIAARVDRVVYMGELNSLEVQRVLQQTKVLISGCSTEALGLSYIEGLSQGCKLVMPMAGGGLEIVEPSLASTVIFPFSPSFDPESIKEAIKRALSEQKKNPPGLIQSFTGPEVASAYLRLATSIGSH
jgi:glycosyltransferase involved in cell wall biosynthesis